jgi:hypothetical protein
MGDFDMRPLHLSLLLILASHAFAQYEPHAIWSREGAGDSSYYGSQILALGDQNGDGFNDFAVFAAGWGPSGQINESRLEFFHGGNPPDTVPYMTRLIDQITERALWGGSTLGDLNGDGYQDWAVVAEVNDSSFDNVWKVYFGGPGPHDNPDLVLPVPWFSGYDGIGDFNGDGFDDLFFSTDGLLEERACILYGGNPMDTLCDWQKAQDLLVKCGFVCKLGSVCW